MSACPVIASMGEMRNAHKTVIRKPEGKRSFGRPRNRWDAQWNWLINPYPTSE
jgi:hypothetical protein